MVDAHLYVLRVLDLSLMHIELEKSLIEMSVCDSGSIQRDHSPPGGCGRPRGVASPAVLDACRNGELISIL